MRGAFGRAWRFAITTFAGGPEAEGGPGGASEGGTTGPAAGCGPGSIGSATDTTGDSAVPGAAGNAAVPESSPAGCTAECSVDAAPSGLAGLGPP